MQASDTMRLSKKDSIALVAIALVGYVILCLCFLVRQLDTKPLPQFLMEDYGCYARALARALRGGDAYADHSTSTGYLYPPQALLLVGALESLGTLDLKFSVFATVSLAGLVGIIVLVLLETGVSVADRRLPPALVLLVSFTPVSWTLYLGQVNIIVSFLIAAGFLLAERRPVWAGVAIACGVALKITPVILLVLFLHKRYRRLNASFAIASLVFLFAAGAVFGFEQYRNFIQMSRELSREFPVGATGSLSIVNSEYLIGLKLGIDILPWAALLQYAHWAMLLVLLGVVTRFTSGVRYRHLLFAIASIGLTIVPNIVWYHHFVFALGGMTILLFSSECPSWLRTSTYVTFGVLQANFLVGSKFDKLTAMPALVCLLIGATIALLNQQARKYSGELTDTSLVKE